MADEDLFGAALNLEDTSYAEGYAQGEADGSRAGRIEGRIFGLEKGFEKFLEMGRLNGRASVWAARLEASSTMDSKATAESASTKQESRESEKASDEAAQVPDIETSRPKLQPLPCNSRLEKHVRSLLELTDRTEISTANDEESVEDFDDRIKRARSKAKVIERIIGETSSSIVTSGGTPDNRAAERGVRVVRAQQQLGTERNIEDFGLKP
jgi:hypothetical protein